MENTAAYFVRTDYIGRPVFATDDTGTVVWTATYLPFGGVHATTGNPIKLRFPGQWFQSETELHQNWMRDYDPTTGRYIQADPLGLVDGASVYTYVRSNPGRYVDPRGLDDIAIGFDIDLTGLSGFEGGVGFVADTDTGMDSGVFGTIGQSVGVNVGAGLGFVYTECDIEGQSHGVDANTPFFGVSIVFGEDTCGCAYFGLSIGVGLGGSSNESRTGTFSLRDYVNWALGRN